MRPYLSTASTADLAPSHTVFTLADVPCAGETGGREEDELNHLHLNSVTCSRGDLYDAYLDMTTRAGNLVPFQDG
jgi:hypothetical protein